MSASSPRLTGIVEDVLRGVGEQNAREHLRDVLHVDQQAHAALLRQMHGLAAGGLAHELHVIGGAPDLVGAGDVGGAHARDRHRVVLDVLLRLKLVEGLVDGVLARAVGRIVFGRRPVAEVALLPAHRDRAGVHHPLHPSQARRLEAVVHPEDVEAHDLVRITLTRSEAVGQVDEPVRLDLEHRPHHVVEPGHVAADQRHLLRHGRKRRHGVRIQIHARHRLAATDEPTHEPGADEPRAADHQYRHGALLSSPARVSQRACPCPNRPAAPRRGRRASLPRCRDTSGSSDHPIARGARPRA